MSHSLPLRCVQLKGKGQSCRTNVIAAWQTSRSLTSASSESRSAECFRRKTRRCSMTVATSTLLGRPLWYELMTTDMKGAEAFYRTVVGWKTTPFEGAGQPYTMV